MIQNTGDAYSHAIRYGSDPQKKHWYICPKYWCIKTNSPITKEQIDEGQCNDEEGNDNSIELYSKDQQVPGFLKEGNHPNKCVPCCFDKWNKTNNVKRRNECGISENDMDVLSGKDDTIPAKRVQYEATRLMANILGPEKFPLDENRSGLLPNSIRMLFNLDYTKKLQKKNTTLLLPNTYALLRYGVEISSNQSFLACMASIHQFITNVKSKLTLSEFRHKIIESITEEDFIMYQNGNLISAFRGNNNEDENSILNINDKENSQYHKLVDKSLHNFKQYLSDPDSFIDHTYLWEIFTKKKEASQLYHLFPNGMNLIIFELKHHDITDSIDIICPSSSTDSLFDSSKSTFFVVKQGNYYEPIYLQQHHNKKNIIKQSNFSIGNVSTFDDNLQGDVENVITLLQGIQTQETNICRSLPSKPEYIYKSNLYANKIVSKLPNTDYSFVKKQISNYQGKIIALLVNKNNDGQSYYLPTAPSYNIPGIDTIFIESLDNSFIHSYTATMVYLNELKQSDPTILCSPMLKMVQDGMVIGIISETNQVILVTPELNETIEENIDYTNIGTFNVSNVSKPSEFIDVESKISLHVDEPTTGTITAKMQIENFFYKSFRSICRTSLADYKNIHYLNKIKQHISNSNLYYQLKLSYIITLLQELIHPFVDFSLDVDDNSYKMLSDIQHFHCNKNTSDLTYCSIDNDIAKLLIPSKNLVNGEDVNFPNNETYYYTKLADELIRNRRIRMYMLYPREYIFTDSVDYEINNNELFLLQSNINKEYFDTLTPIHETVNNYVKYTQYDSVQPILNQTLPKEPISLFQMNSKRNAHVTL